MVKQIIIDFQTTAQVRFHLFLLDKFLDEFKKLPPILCLVAVSAQNLTI